MAQPRAAFGGAAPQRPPHPATVAQPRAPHPATVAQPRAPLRGAVAQGSAAKESTYEIKGKISGLEALSAEELKSLVVMMDDQPYKLQNGNTYSIPGLAAGTKGTLVPRLGDYKFAPEGQPEKDAQGRVKFTLRKDRQIDFTLPSFTVKGNVAGMSRPKDKGIKMLAANSLKKVSFDVGNDGNYAMKLPAGAYEIAPVLDKVVFDPEKTKIDLTKDEQRQSFKVKECKVSFKVRGIDRERVALVSAKVVPTEKVPADPINDVICKESAEPNPAGGGNRVIGVAEIKGLPAGRRYTASLVHAGFLDVSVEGLNPKAPTRELDLKADTEVIFTVEVKKFTISGTLSMEDGSKKGGIDVYLVCDGKDLGSKASQNDGRYEFRNVEGGKRYVIEPDPTKYRAETTFDAWRKEVACLSADQKVDFSRGVSVQYDASYQPYLRIDNARKAYLTKHAMDSVRQQRGANQAGHSVLLHVYKDAITRSWSAAYTKEPLPTYRLNACDGSGRLRLVMYLEEKPNVRSVHTCFYDR